jgi:hypothetical protein
MDFLAVHWYGGANATVFKANMKSIRDQYNGRWPLLITEFAPADWTATTLANNKYSRSDVLAFMKEVLPWIEKQKWITGYAWFSFNATSAPGGCSALFEVNGTMTALGRYYASVRSDNITGDQSIVVN